MCCIITSKLLQSQGIHKKGLETQTETHPITWMAMNVNLLSNMFFIFFWQLFITDVLHGVLIMVTGTCLTTLTVECYNKVKCL